MIRSKLFSLTNATFCRSPRIPQWTLPRSISRTTTQWLNIALYYHRCIYSFYPYFFALNNLIIYLLYHTYQLPLINFVFIVYLSSLDSLPTPNYYYFRITFLNNTGVGIEFSNKIIEANREIDEIQSAYFWMLDGLLSVILSSKRI